MTSSRASGIPAANLVEDGSRTLASRALLVDRPSPYLDRCRRVDARSDRGAPRHAADEAAHPAVEVSPPDIAQRRTMAGHGIGAESIQFTGDVCVKYRFRAPLHLLVAYERGTRRDDQIFVAGVPRPAPPDLVRKLTFVPAGQEYAAWHRSRANSHIVYVYFDPAKFKIRPGLDTPDGLAAPRLFFEDATLWHTVLKLKRLIEFPGPADQEYFEALGNVLVHELARLDRAMPGTQSQARGGLAAWQQRAVCAYIEDHLAERIPLATLARLARLSPHHFCRCFKQSFGSPPHRYQIDRRIECAQRLLEQPTISITEITFAMGFGNLNSFTAAFRNAIGLTPTAYRRSLAGIAGSAAVSVRDLVDSTKGSSTYATAPTS